MLELSVQQGEARLPKKPKRRRRGAPLREGLRMRELAALTGLSPRLITHYVAAGIIEAPEFHASDTRYQRVHLLRLLAVRPLKAQGLKLDQVRARLNGWGVPGLEDFLRTLPLSEAARQALGWAAQQTAAAALIAASPIAASPGAATPTQAEHWQRIVILPGLELMLRGDVSPIVQEVASRVIETFRALS
jgi:DNA-binding transcriptional MerR regulator